MSDISDRPVINCMECSEHYIMDYYYQYVWCGSEIKCQHPTMNDHRTLKCVSPDWLEALSELEAPKMCPLLKEVENDKR